MTWLHEAALMVTKSVEGFPGRTSEWYTYNIDWLKNTSIFGVEAFLVSAENRGYIKSKMSKDKKDIVYFATKEGKKAYKKYNPS